MLDPPNLGRSDSSKMSSKKKKNARESRLVIPNGGHNEEQLGEPCARAPGLGQFDPGEITTKGLVP